MKKHLFIGLAIIIITNLVVLIGVAYNRMGKPTSQLLLTERELSLPYRFINNKERNDLSLRIHWRMPSNDDDLYSYSSKDIELDQATMKKLGFNPSTNYFSFNRQSQELYWALEFDGALYQDELNKAEKRLKQALIAFEENPSDNNKDKIKRAENKLDEEKNNASRLFFIEAAADLQSLIDKFNNQKSVLLVKGQTSAYYSQNKKKFYLSLKQLSIEQIMVSFNHAELFAHIKQQRNGDKALKYIVDVKWGKRLEPWIDDIKTH